METEANKYDGYNVVVAAKTKKPRLFNVRQIHVARMHDFLKECSNDPNSTIQDACIKFIAEFNLKSEDKTEDQICKHVTKKIIDKFKLIVHRKVYSSLSKEQLEIAQKMLQDNSSMSIFDIGKNINHVDLSWNDLFLGCQQARKRGRQKSSFYNICKLFSEDDSFKNDLNSLYEDNKDINFIKEFIVEFCQNNSEFSNYESLIDNDFVSYLLYSFLKLKKRGKRISSEVRETVRNRIKELYSDKSIKLKNIANLINQEFGINFKPASITTMISIYKLNSENKRTKRSTSTDSFEDLSEDQRVNVCNLFVQGKSINEIHNYVKAEFDKDIKKTDLRTYITSMGLSKQKTNISTDEKNWLKENYSMYIDSDDITGKFNELFNHDFSVTQIMELVGKA